VSTAYHLLGIDWDAAREWWAHQGMKTPPVMITVANRTETAARIKYAFDHGKIRIENLSDPARTLHIDSKVLDKAEAMDDSTSEPSEPGGSSPRSDEDDDAPVKKLTKDEQARLLRETVDSVGKVGKPGEQIQNVISVAMLSEGWDAKTVTHIMGLRAFTSQLLCEQVVGRGLRRTSYEAYVNDEGVELFQPEYVNIFGVPFTFLPHEGGDGKAAPPPQPKTRIEPLAEREQPFAISWPQVIRIEHEFRPQLTLDLDELPVLKLSASDAPTRAELAKVIAGKPDLSSLTNIEL
jgi:type III restriction enzyme